MQSQCRSGGALTRGLRLASCTALAAVVSFGGAVTANASVSGGTINATGPLTTITTTRDLNCAVHHIDDTHGEFYGDTACGTLVFFDGLLYGPTNIPAGGATGPRSSYLPVSQVGRGSGTSASPYAVETVVALGTSGVTLTQTDTYEAGQAYYSTSITLRSNAGSSVSGKSAIIYRAGDCYLQNSDEGSGAIGQSWVACTAPGSGRVQEWVDTTGGATKAEGYYGNVWSMISTHQMFPNTADTTVVQDNGAGLSWKVTFNALGIAPVVNHQLSFTQTEGLASKKYFALGDSFSSGEGVAPFYAGTDSATNKCHRSKLAYSQLITGNGTSQLAPPKFVACSGAVSQDFVTTNHSYSTELAQIPLIDPDTQYVSFSVGGNDAGFAAAVKACVDPNPFAGQCQDSALSLEVARRLSALAGPSGSGPTSQKSPDDTDIYAWRSLIEKVHDRAPQARIILIDYPQLFNPDGPHMKDGKCPVGGALNQDHPMPLYIDKAEAQWIYDEATIAKKGLARVASYYEYVTFVDVQPKFAGHLLCDNQPWINAIVPASGLITTSVDPKSVHPTAAGQQAMASAILEVIG